MRFTREHPDHTGSLSLLDFSLKITEERAIYTEFYRKVASRDMFGQYNSALSLGTKIGYARNDLSSTQRKCSKTKNKVSHTTCFLGVLKINRYPISIINPLKYPGDKNHRTHRKPSNTCLLKIRNFNVRISATIRKAIRRES